MNYPITLGILYKTDSEYQKCFCALINKTVTLETFDDEWSEERVTLFLNFIYTKTSSFYLFQQLYISAAATMMTLDPEMGLAILFSFTYLEFFHPCLVAFFQSNQEIPENHPSFLLLKDKLNKK